MPAYSLNDLAAFATVAGQGSYTRAAAALGTSKSNLSHTIRRLETALGYRLLQRTSRSVAPTEAGEALLATLAPALETISAVLDDLDRNHDQVTGTLRITATRQAYEAVIQPMLADFLSDHPRAVVEVLVDYAYRDIVADRLDAGIRLGEKLEQDMVALRVGPDLRMAVVAAPSYLTAKRAPVRHPHDLLAHRCINYRMVRAGTIYAWEFEQAGRALDVQVPGPLIFNDPELMLAAALDGLGVGYLLDHEVAPHVEAGRLVRLLADWTPPFPGFHLYYPSRRQMRPILRAFIDRLRQGRQDGSAPSG
ncbi:LysR family transcriptional regulator [Aureimonas phyllosphaerae]|uniref:LysR family transcriptional regulator n=1 Tax=Aureimonas phyllosphaerae TaxID=1166078 RepID=UPI003A5C1244